MKVGSRRWSLRPFICILIRQGISDMCGRSLEGEIFVPPFRSSAMRLNLLCQTLPGEEDHPIGR